MSKPEDRWTQVSKAQQFCFECPLCNGSVIINAMLCHPSYVTYSPASYTYSWMQGGGMDAPGLQISAMSSQQSSNSWHDGSQRQKGGYPLHVSPSPDTQHFVYPAATHDPGRLALTARERRKTKNKKLKNVGLTHAIII